MYVSNILSHLIQYRSIYFLQQPVTVNENLEKENRQYKDGASPQQSTDTSGLQDEVRRLQAQNSALQKNLACKYKCQVKIEQLKNIGN